MWSFNEKLVTIRNRVMRNKIVAILSVVVLILIFVSLLVSGFITSLGVRFAKLPVSVPTAFATPTEFITPTPTDIPFTTYTKPVIEKKDRYDIYLIGDSMTHAFGPRGGIFNELLSQAFPGTFFEISNYAEANQSILLLPARLQEPVQADHDLLLNPVLEGEPELIIIESFGYNPLSQFGLEEGLKKQEEVLTDVMTTLTNRFPDTAIMFLATIAPDKLSYARNVNQGSADGRWAQAEERIEYITNHIEYANEHNIPVINAYQESLDADGDGDTKYINPDDNIHPSAEGLALIGRIITQKIVEESIFPEPE